MTKGISIIKSIKEPFDIAENFIKTLSNDGIDCNSFYAEELVFSNFSHVFPDLKQVVYLFNNIQSAHILASFLEHNNREVINFKYFKNNYSKEIVQLLLFQNGLQVPKSYFSPEIAQLSRAKKDLTFPLIIKSQKHGGEIHVLNSYSEYMRFVFQNKVAGSVYAEEFLDSNNYKMFKVYCIGKEIFFDSSDSRIKSTQLIKDLSSIGEIFSLEVYSVDCFLSLIDKEVFFIDVNPSPAFGQSVEAYNYFIQYLKSKLQ